jgi:hypothetical protein
MTYQVEASAVALRALEVDFLIGLPVSEEWSPSHQTMTEYLANALYGFRVGLTSQGVAEVIDGIALYPHWEISADEWALVGKLP